ncbi:MAG: hypothetical protein GY903_15175 [Fuerstiella sp.]|nr:hypothetical protein [Fuerstiella sp.]MCP4855824.1 hypothetical protein [Fuerstiella sp.]
MPFKPASIETVAGRGECVPERLPYYVLDRTNEKVARILSDEQKTKWKEMVVTLPGKELSGKI